MLKLILDYVLAVAPMTLLLVPIAVLALLIQRDTPEPVFFRQERIGQNGRPFQIWKFRTMRLGADLELDSLHSPNEHMVRCSG